jgi:hypothetical protein
VPIARLVLLPLGPHGLLAGARLLASGAGGALFGLGAGPIGLRAADLGLAPDLVRLFAARLQLALSASPS